MMLKNLLEIYRSICATQNDICDHMNKIPHPYSKKTCSPCHITVPIIYTKCVYSKYLMIKNISEKQQKENR